MGTFLALLAYVCTDNLSTAIIIFCITAGMIFVAHPKTRIFLIIAAVAIAVIWRLACIYYWSECTGDR